MYPCVCFYGSTYRGGRVFGPVGPGGAAFSAGGGGGHLGAYRPLLRGGRQEQKAEEEQGQDKVRPGEEGLHPARLCQPRWSGGECLSCLAVASFCTKGGRNGKGEKRKPVPYGTYDRGEKGGNTETQREKKLGLSHLGPTN